MDWKDILIAFVVIVTIIIIVRIIAVYLLFLTLDDAVHALTGHTGKTAPVVTPTTTPSEQFSTTGPKVTQPTNDQQVGQTLDTYGYNADAPWDEVLQATELDPSIYAGHQTFVKDVRQFSSGANFTSVTDDNTNSAFTNFVGLRRPQHVPIGADARQQPDIDESVLQRNPDFRFNGY